MADRGQIVSISVIPRDFEEEVPGMRGYPRYTVGDHPYERCREKGGDTLQEHTLTRWFGFHSST